MTDLEIARDLRAAAEYLRVCGWTHGEFGTPGGPRCLVGAFLVAVNYAPDCLSRISTDLDPHFEGCAMIWNDKPGRTAEEVIDRLESAALNLEIKALAASTESLAAERLELVGNIS